MKKHIKKIKKTTQTHKVTAPLFAVIFAALGVLVLTVTHAATIGSLSLTTPSTNVSLGSTVSVTVLVDSGTNNVNTVESDLTYDKTKLQPVNVVGVSTVNGSTVAADPNSKFDFTVEPKAGPIVAETVDSNTDMIRITKGDLTPGSGQQNFATVNFKTIGVAPASSKANITVANSSLVFTTANANIFTQDNTANSLDFTITDTTAPSAPTGLAASGTTVKSTNLSWGASTDDLAVASYDIYQGTTKIGSSATTSFSATISAPGVPLKPNTAYTFKVRALDAAGNASAFSSVLPVTTLADTTAPTLPTALTAPTVTGTSVTLNWTASTDNVEVAGYNIYRNGTKITTSPTNSFTNTGLTSGATYTYAVQAYDAAGNTSAQTATVSATTTPDSVAPTSPTSLISPSKTNISANISWAAATDNIGVTGYNVYRNGTKVTTTSSTSFADTSLAPGIALTPGTTYTYKVEAFDSAGNTSSQTSALTVTLGIKMGDITGPKVTINGVDSYPPDNLVDGTDFSVLALNFRKTSATRFMGDLDGNSIVEPADLSRLLSTWGT